MDTEYTTRMFTHVDAGRLDAAEAMADTLIEAGQSLSESDRTALAGLFADTGEDPADWPALTRLLADPEPTWAPQWTPPRTAYDAGVMDGMDPDYDRF